MLCTVIKRNGEECHRTADHAYKGRPLCEKHWNNGHLTKHLPAEDVREARRRIRALAEIAYICNTVLDAVVHNLSMSYANMAAMAKRIASVNRTLTRRELADTIQLIVMTVKLRRETTAANEHKALHLLGTLIQNLYSE